MYVTSPRSVQKRHTKRPGSGCSCGSRPCMNVSNVVHMSGQSPILDITVVVQIMSYIYCTLNVHAAVHVSPALKHRNYRFSNLGLYGRYRVWTKMETYTRTVPQGDGCCRQVYDSKDGGKRAGRSYLLRSTADRVC